MESEYIACSHACKDLYPIMDLINKFAVIIDIPTTSTANLHIMIHEDNIGALTLCNLEPRQLSPRSKHYALKCHWFCKQLKQHNIMLTKISTEDQTGDIFTKGLGTVPFTCLQKKLMGW